MSADSEVNVSGWLPQWLGLARVFVTRTGMLVGACVESRFSCDVSLLLHITLEMWKHGRGIVHKGYLNQGSRVQDVVTLLLMILYRSYETLQRS